MNKNILKTLKYFYKKNTKEVVGGSLAILILSLLVFPQPLLVKHLIDNVLLKGGDYKKFCVIICLYLIIILLQVSFNYIKRYAFGLLDEKILLEMETSLFKKIQYSKVKSTRNWSNGYILSRIQNDILSFRSMFFPSIAVALKQILTLFVGLTAVFILNVRLALISILLYPLFIYIMWFYNKKIRKVSRCYFESRSRKVSALSESIRLISLFKDFSRESVNVSRFFKSSRKLFSIGMIRLRISVNYEILLEIILSLIPLSVFAYGGVLILRGNLTLGALVAFNSYMGYIYNPTSSLLHFNITMQKSLEAWKRIEEILNLPDDDNHGLGATHIEQIKFNDVSFSYDNSKVIFDNISMEFNQGDMIGVIGNSGIGKTTLLKLITGESSPDNGCISINGTELTQYNIYSYRNQLSKIEQEPLLFRDTVMNNIALGKRNAAFDEIEQASRQAQIHEFISTLDNRYKTVIDEGGKNISIGQKQRIALARALLKKSSLLLLDEPTSSIDQESEDKLRSVLKSISHDKIVIIVSHKSSILENCNKIVEVKDKKIYITDKNVTTLMS